MTNRATLEEMVLDLARRVARLEGASRVYGPIEAKPATGDAATLAKVFGHSGPFGEDGALLAVGYSESQ